MPNMVKIGRTSRLEVEERMKELYSTGVPVPFVCFYACRVKNAARVEKDIHFAFGDQRVNANREFFKIAPERVQAVLKHFQVEEVTNDINREIEEETDATDQESAKKLYREQRRPNLRFDVIGISDGSIIKFRDTEQSVKVVGDRKVDLNGEIMSLTMATRRLLGKPDNYPIQPSPYWTFNGMPLIDIYESFHSTDE